MLFLPLYSDDSSHIMVPIFFLLPRANRCSLDLPHLLGITVESRWRFSIQEPLHWALCTWAQHSQSSPAWSWAWLVRARQLLQQILIIVRAGVRARSPGHLYHIMEMQLLLPWDGVCCGSVINSRYSFKIVPFSKQISTRKQEHQPLSLGRSLGGFFLQLCESLF